MIKAVMFFGDNPASATTWWAEATGTPVHYEGEFSFIEMGDLEVDVHPNGDGRNPQGSSTVAYFRVDNVEAERHRFLGLGCQAHRHPLEPSPTRQITQLKYPFGNVFGLDGP
ncbi:MAG TPA: VOC family protein [Acidimicrobiales bacterium]